MDYRVTAALKIIESEYAQHPRAQEVARRIGVSVSHLRSLFKEATGQTFNRYLCRYRVGQGKAMIRASPDLRIEELATALGYKHVSNLDRDFRKCGGRSPRSVRKCVSKRFG
jgi:AraC-like DNA-binding protein